MYIVDKTNHIIETKWRAGKYLVPVRLKFDGDRIELKHRYNKVLIKEIKDMEGHRWHGFDDQPRKIWSVSNTSRNLFQIAYLEGLNPYEKYDLPLLPCNTDRSLYEHQTEMVQFGLTRHHCILACEMGTGKTLVAIEVMEQARLTNQDCWYVGPKSGVLAVNRELHKWNSDVWPEMMTYEHLVKILRNWKTGNRPPKCVIFDESSKIKNPTAQRSQAAFHLAQSVRDEWMYDGFVMLLSGTPAPKSPSDWFHQCETAQPGFLKEGTIHKFQNKLRIVEMRESLSGGTYPHIVTWLDDSNKCAVCGELRDAAIHNDVFGMSTGDAHQFVPSVNEVERLYKRLNGLVLVKFKKDCTDLPDKVYEIRKITPNVQTLRAAKLLKKLSRRAITTAILLRELSDGFQYVDKDTGEKTECPACNGTGIMITQVPVGSDDEEDRADAYNPLAKSVLSDEKITMYEDDGSKTHEIAPDEFEKDEIICTFCGGAKKIPKIIQETHEIPTPKDDLLIELLEEHVECGRFIVWGGFTGTIDRIIRICHQQGWTTLRVDGKGYTGMSPLGVVLDFDELLAAMDGSAPNKAELLERYPKLCFVGNAKSGGMALTLTSSPTMFYYSNSFDGEARMQSEDRHHRLGMDTNRGAKIIDVVHLPADLMVLNNLKKKKRMQSMTMGDYREAMRLAEEEYGRLV